MAEQERNEGAQEELKLNSMKDLLEMSSLREMLFNLLKAVSLNSYSPYSKFKVGAVLVVLSPAGELLLFKGTNTENSSFGLSVCAERVAVFKAISEGAHPDRGFKWLGMAVYTPTEIFTLPCGACRQVMSEFKPDLDIVTFNVKGEYKLFNLSELLPHQFHFEAEGHNDV